MEFAGAGLYLLSLEAALGACSGVQWHAPPGIPTVPQTGDSSSRLGGADMFREDAGVTRRCGLGSEESQTPLPSRVVVNCTWLTQNPRGQLSSLTAFLSDSIPESCSKCSPPTLLLQEVSAGPKGLNFNECRGVSVALT